jgi:hypothetical protein
VQDVTNIIWWDYPQNINCGDAWIGDRFCGLLLQETETTHTPLQIHLDAILMEWWVGRAVPNYPLLW